MNDDGLLRHATELPLIGRAHSPDPLHHVHPFGNFTEHRVADSLGRSISVIETRVVIKVDEELLPCAIGLGETGHGDCAAAILQALSGFVQNRPPESSADGLEVADIVDV